MAGKNTAVFGIYQDRATVESAVGHVANRRASAIPTFQFLFPYNEGTKDFAAREKHQGS